MHIKELILFNNGNGQSHHMMLLHYLANASRRIVCLPCTVAGENDKIRK
jgi:hypothetical protein